MMEMVIAKKFGVKVKDIPVYSNALDLVIPD